jgi:hypothetical protein
MRIELLQIVGVEIIRGFFEAYLTAGREYFRKHHKQEYLNHG